MVELFMSWHSPQTAREWQWAQHAVGGLYNILLMTTGALFGRGDWAIGILLSIITFIVNRVSSEIAYQVQVKVIKEHSNK